MDVNQLEVLVAVAKEQSFSRAALSLHRTQPAVSQAIRRLEAELGEPLFDRSSKDGTLTAAGRVLCDFAEQMLNLRNGDIRSTEPRHHLAAAARCREGLDLWVEHRMHAETR